MVPDYVAPVIAAGVFILLIEFVREPARRTVGALQINRMRLISRCGGSPNRRLYSRLNCEALS